MGNSFRQPYGLPPSRAVETALLLFPRICCASAREPYILPPQSCRRCSIGQQSTFSRGRDRARSGNSTLHVPFPSSQVAKSTPGSLQESTCSPLKPTPKKILRLFLGTPWEAPIMRKKTKSGAPFRSSAFDRCLLSPWLLSARRLPSRRNNRSSCRRGAQLSAHGSAGTRQASEPLPYSLQNACSFCSWTVFPWGLP